MLVNLVKTTVKCENVNLVFSFWLVVAAVVISRYPWNSLYGHTCNVNSKILVILRSQKAKERTYPIGRKGNSESLYWLKSL